MENGVMKNFRNSAQKPLSTQVVLRGYLLLEERLNAIVKNSLYNPALAEKLNLNFHHKLLFARTFTVSLRGEGMWDFLAAINVLRNSIAHSLDAEKRRKKFQTVKALYLRELEDAELKKRSDEPDHLLFLMAYALCERYFRRAQEDTEMVGKMIRHMIGAMRKELYQPD